jgi:hypothetical protein
MGGSIRQRIVWQWDNAGAPCHMTVAAQTVAAWQLAVQQWQWLLKQWQLDT